MDVSLATLFTSIVGLLIAASGVPLAKRMAVRYGIVSKPSDDRWHREPTPLLGGAAVVAGFLGALLLLGHVPIWLAVGAIVLFAIGLLDDAIVLRPRVKFTLQLLAVALVIRSAPIFNILPWPPLNVLLTILWLVTTINAVNLIDGLDGLAAGLGISSALTVAVLAGLHHQDMVLGWALALAGALGGFLLYNRSPASIFMGDAGALPIGFILGALSIEAGGFVTHSRLSAAAVPLLVMLVPVTDTSVVTITRLATGRAISRRGLDHFHHRMAKLGLSDPRTVEVMCALAIAGGACAIALSFLRQFYVVAALSAGLLFFTLVGLFLIDLSLEHGGTALEQHRLSGLAGAILSLNLKRRVFEIALDGLLITVAYCAAVLIRLDFVVEPGLFSLLTGVLPWVIGTSYVAFFIAGIYRGMWRHFGLEDALRSWQGAMLAGLLLFAIRRFGPVRFSGSILCIFVILVFNLLLATRLSFRVFRKTVDSLVRPRSSAIVVGADSSGEAALWHLLSIGGKEKIRMLGFVDDDAFKRGKLFHGYRVLGSISELDRIYGDTAFDAVLIAGDTLSKERLELIESFVSARKLQLRRFSMGISDVANGSETQQNPASGEILSGTGTLGPAAG